MIVRHNAKMTSDVYSAASIANFIVTKTNFSVTNLKLQKMLYFAQGFFLGRYGKELFKDAIQAWTYGPVVPNVYNSYMGYGSQYITSTLNAEDIKDEEVKEVLSGIVSSMEKYSASDLVAMTHLPNTPWSRIWRGGLGRFEEIPVSLIKEYFIPRCKKNA